VGVSAKIVAWTGSGVVVVCLVALAAPAFIGVIDAVRPAVAAAPEHTPTQSAAAAQPATTNVAETADPTPNPDGEYGDCAVLYYPDADPGPGPRLDAPIENGPRQFATGKATYKDGVPATYTVAPGDAMQAIGARFCVFSAGLYYFNDLQKQGAIQPGDVLHLH
jgi:hypothetical protein